MLDSTKRATLMLAYCEADPSTYQQAIAEAAYLSTNAPDRHDRARALEACEAIVHLSILCNAVDQAMTHA